MNIRILAKGFSESISAIIIGSVILTLILFNIYTVVLTTSFLHNITSKNQRNSELRILNTQVFANGTIVINMTNTGPLTLENIKKIEVVVKIITNNSSTTYLVKYDEHQKENSWIFCGVYVEKMLRSLNTDILRPGETMCIKLKINSIPEKSYVILTIYTPSGEKTEYIDIAR